MSTFKPSVYQQKIFDFIEKESGNAVINAVAGSGKTTTIVEALNLIPKDKKVIFVAFNKTIVNELVQRVPSHVEVKTMHSFGFSTVRENLGSVQVKDDKVMEIIKQLYPTWNVPEEVEEGYMSRVRQIVDLAKLNLSDNIADLYEVVDHHGVETLNAEVEKAWMVYEVARNFKKMIDMTDMIFLPAYYKFRCKQYDWVFVDECQDLNRCQQEILKLMIKPHTGRFVAVGDPRQAIYGFAGADAKSFQALTEIPNTITLPLSVNYRCGSKIIEMAKNIVPQLEAFENAIEGEIDQKASWKQIYDGDYVLCRNVKPLVKLCMEFLISGKKAFVRGRDIGKNMISMLERTKTPKMQDAIMKLKKDAQRMAEKSIARGKTSEEVYNGSAYKSSMDKIEAIEILAGDLVFVSDVVKKIDSLFSDTTSGIILSTIHKSKGLEANNVYILNHDLMPSKWAKKDWEIEQENNLIYVAYTRAKRKLGIIADYDGTSDSPFVSSSNTFKDESIQEEWNSQKQETTLRDFKHENRGKIASKDFGF
jgi:DNA helicase-2/ATP-dependent DNA helicase PcrA